MQSESEKSIFFPTVSRMSILPGGGGELPYMQVRDVPFLGAFFEQEINFGDHFW